MSEAWSAQDVRDWLRPAFEWLAQETADEESERVWEGDLSQGFLAQLGLSDENEFPVVAQLFERLRGMESDEERGEFLLDEGQREPVLEELITQWEAAQQSAAEPVEQPEPYWDGEKWLTYNADAGEWQPMPADEAPAAPGGEEPSAAAADEPAAEGEEAAEKPLPTPEELAADIVENIVGPAVADLAEAVPAVASMSSEELHALLSEVIAERVAAS